MACMHGAIVTATVSDDRCNHHQAIVGATVAPTVTPIVGIAPLSVVVMTSRAKLTPLSAGKQKNTSKMQQGKFETFFGSIL